MTKTNAPEFETGAALIELEIVIRAPIQRVWKALVEETFQWWRKDFLSDPATLKFVIEPRLGGRMYEDWGHGEGLVWATISAIRAPFLLEMSGVSSPAFGGPRTHYHAFRLEEKGGATVLRFTDALHGRIEASTRNTLQEGWLLLFNEALREYCEQA